MAVESSADSYINAQPEEIMDYDTFWEKNNSYGTASPENQLMVRFLNFFTGEDKRVHDKYDAYVTNTNNRNKWLAEQSSRQYDQMMDNSKIQREMRDFAAAGLNPYLILNNGSLSTGNPPTSSRAEYSSHRKGDVSNSNAGRNIALLLLAVARVAAAFL